MRCFLSVITFVFILWGCNSGPEEPVSPWGAAPCDTCDNYYPDPRTIYDSIIAFAPDPIAYCTKYKAYRAAVSPDGRHIVYRAYNTDRKRTNNTTGFPFAGLAIMELETGRFTDFLPGGFQTWVWTPDGRGVAYTLSGGSSPYIYNLDTKQSRFYPEAGWFDGLRATPSGNYLYGVAAHGYYPNAYAAGIRRWDTKADTAAAFLTEREFRCNWNDFFFIGDETLCGFVPHASTPQIRRDTYTDTRDTLYPLAPGLYFYNIRTRELTHKEVPALQQALFHLNSVIRFSISPDGRTALLDYARSVWTLDIHSQTLTEVLGSHADYRFYERNPVWHTNTTFFASWWCRKDSSETIWEYRLDGTPVRQITYRHSRFWEPQG